MTVRLPGALSARTDFEQAENLLARRRDELTRAGHALVDLTVTNPTACGLALISPALPELHRYEPEPLGLLAAREAIAALHAVTAAQVVLTSSTSEGYSWLFKLLCDPGDDVLVPAPCYPLFDYLARLEGVGTHAYPLQLSAGRFELDVGLVEGSATPRTRAVLVVSPANPTGQVLQPGELERLSELCARRGWALLVDEVFRDPSRHGPSAGARPLPCLTFVLAGLSKLVGLPQLKLGWIAASGPAAAVGAAITRLELIGDTYLPVSAPVQHAAAGLLAQRSRFLEAVRARVEGNVRTLRGLRPAGARWECLAVEGGWSQVVRVGAQPGEEALCLAALERGVVVHPGYFYDFPSGAWLVVSLLPPPERFDDGARRLAALLDAS